MNVQEDEGPGGYQPQDPDRDVLAERRARRGEPIGDPILIRRAETAEATAHALEDRLTGIQTRLREAEQEARSASERLTERERELMRASERLTDGERQLSTISVRLADRERELQSVSERLGQRERELHTVSERLAEREQQLHKAELEIRGRVEVLERRVGEVQHDLDRERTTRERAEQELEALRATQAAMLPLVSDLRDIAQRLRLAAESETPGAQAPTLEVPPISAAAPVASPGAEAGPSSLPQPSQAGTLPDAGNAQMAEALAAAVQRLRARVAAVGELQETPPGEPGPATASAEPGPATAPAQPAGQAAPEQTAEDLEIAEETDKSEEQEQEPAGEAPAAGAPYVPPHVIERAPARAWLAPAIRRVAERRDPRLAAELVLELLPAQALAIDRPIRYLAKIAELGAYEISLDGGHGAVRDLAGAGLIDSRTFLLEGPASAFAEVAAGGSKLSAWRPPFGLRVRGGRRRAKRLLASRRSPLALGDLAAAGVTVWPGLLLLALAEAIDPTSTTGHTFTVAFTIEGQQSAVLQVQALNGKPLAVARGNAEADAVGSDAASSGEASTDAHPGTTVRLSEQAFSRLLTAQDLGDETVMLEGETAPLETLLSWTDRVQGIRRFGA